MNTFIIHSDCMIYSLFLLPVTDEQTEIQRKKYWPQQGCALNTPYPRRQVNLARQEMKINKMGIFLWNAVWPVLDY